MSQSLSRRSFLKCAGSGAVSLAAALLTGVSAAAAQPRVMGQPALLDGKAAVELLGYAPAPGLGGVLVYLSVENLTARTLPVGASYLHSRDVSTLKELYSLDSGVTARCGGQSVPCGSFAAPLYAENAADASVFTLNLAAGRGAMLHCFCAVPEDWEALELSYRPAFAAGQPVEFVVRRDADAVRLGPVPARRRKSEALWICKRLRAPVARGKIAFALGLSSLLRTKREPEWFSRLCAGWSAFSLRLIVLF